VLPTLLLLPLLVNPVAAYQQDSLLLYLLLPPFPTNSTADMVAAAC
jgi:hypothetical protein